MMAPVEGSGTWPAWMQIVLNLAVSRRFTRRQRPIPTWGCSGASAHLDAPATRATWVMCDGDAGRIADQAPPMGAAAISDSPLWRTHLAVRAVALPADAIPRYAVIVDVPITAATGLQIQNETGIELGDISTLGMTKTDVTPITGRAIEEDSTRQATSQRVRWMTFLDYSDWA